MKVIERNSCVICRENDLEDLINLKKFPVFIGATSEPYTSDKFHDMSWGISKKSGVIQLKKLLPLNLIYSEFHSEAVGAVWENHRKEFSKFIRKNKTSGDVLEMGGSDAKQASLHYELNKETEDRWHIVEPNIPKNFKAPNTKIKYLDGYIEEKLENFSTIKNFVHSHVLEHLYEPDKIVDAVADKQKKGDRVIFSIPDLKYYLENLFVNALNFEHTYYITDEIVEFLFKNRGYKLVDKESYINHSIFYCYEKIDKPINTSLPNEHFYNKNKKAYLDLVKFYKDEVAVYNNQINNHVGEVYLFGGHIFSQFLLYLGLHEEKITSILDNSKQKQNKRLYGFNLNIYNPEVIKNSKSPLVILKVGQYFNEIKNQLLKINPNVKIVK